MRFETFVVAFCLAIQVQAAPLETRGFTLCLPGSLGKIVSGFLSTVSGLFSKWFSKRSDELAYFQVQELLDELENTGLYSGFVSHYVNNHPDFHKEFEGCLESSIKKGDISLDDIYYSMEMQGLFEHFYEKHMKHTKPKLSNLFNSEGLKHEVYGAKKTENHPHVSYYEDKHAAEMETLSKLAEYGIEEPYDMYEYILELLSDAHLTEHVTRSLVERDNGQETVDWLINYMQTHSADDVLKTIKESNVSQKLVDLALTHPDYWSWVLGKSEKKKRSIIGTVWNLFTGGSSSSSNSTTTSTAATTTKAATTSTKASTTSTFSLVTGTILASANTGLTATTTSKTGSVTTTLSTATSSSTSGSSSGTNLVGSILSITWDIIKAVVNGSADLSTPSTIGKIILGALRFVVNLLGGGSSSSSTVSGLLTTTKASGTTTLAATTTTSGTKTTTATGASSTGSLTSSSLLGLISGLFKREFADGYGILGDVIEDLYVREIENGVDLSKKSLEGFPKNREELEVFKREMADYFVDNLLSEFAKKLKF